MDIIVQWPATYWQTAHASNSAFAYTSCLLLCSCSLCSSTGADASNGQLYACSLWYNIAAPGFKHWHLAGSNKK